MSAQQDSTQGAGMPVSLSANATKQGRAFETVIELCRGVDVASLAPEPALGWSAVWAVACEQGLAIIVGSKLLERPDLIDPDLAIAIRRDIRANSMRALALSSETVRTVAALKSKGVVAAIFKGAMLAGMAHGDLGTRHAGDIDLFVHKEDCERAIAVLRECGYETDSSWKISILPGRLAFDCECELTNVARRACIDLHWEFTTKNFSMALPVRSMMSRLVSVEFCGSKVLTFRPEDQVLTLSLHGAKHCWVRIEWAYTVAALIHRHPQLDWALILSEAEASGADHFLGSGLLLANRLFAAPLPAEILERFNNDPIANEMVRRCMRWATLGSLPTVFETRCYHALGRSSFFKKIQYWIGIVITPSLKDYWLPLPAALVMLYYPFRAIRYACRALIQILNHFRKALQSA